MYGFSEFPFYEILAVHRFGFNCHLWGTISEIPDLITNSSVECTDQKSDRITRFYIQGWVIGRLYGRYGLFFFTPGINLYDGKIIINIPFGISYLKNLTILTGRFVGLRLNSSICCRSISKCPFIENNIPGVTSRLAAIENGLLSGP